MLCLDDILLMQLKAVPSWGKNATKVGSSLCRGVTILGGWRDQRIYNFILSPSLQTNIIHFYYSLQ
jgi:hypothetical protein